MEGVKICRRAPMISHLLFADDSLLFFWASEPQATVVKGLLNTYVAAMGQLINLQSVPSFFRKTILSW